jgi:DNA-nicking Smr family endonuclease
MTNNDDKKIWQAYAKNVKRLRLGATKESAINPGTPENQCEMPDVIPTKKSHEIADPPLTHTITTRKEKYLNISLDRHRERELRRGAIRIEARLDLHGMTQVEAYAALAKFLTTEAKAGRRNLLVITGKGHAGQGVLRSNLAGWLESLPLTVPILALRPAAPKDGGTGAFYVLLKRPN